MNAAKISLIGSLSKGWMAKTLNVAFDREYYFNPQRRLDIDRQCNAYARRELADLNIFYTESNLGELDHHADNQVLVGGIQPNMVLGMLVGAEFIAQDSMDADISITPLKGRDPDSLPAPEDLLEHELVKLFDEQIRELRSQGELTPIPPFFWDSSGRATTHGTLTTAQKFLGEDVFMDLMTAPDKVTRVMDWITQSFIVLMRHFSEIGELPISSVHIGECSGCMVNPQMFNQFVVPHASMMAEALGSLRFHSCGPSTHLLGCMKDINKLTWLDLGSDTSIAQTRQVFGRGFPIDVAPMPADLSADSSAPILDWAQQIVSDNNGGPLRILYHLEPDYKLDVVRALSEYISGL